MLKIFYTGMLRVKKIRITDHLGININIYYYLK